MTDIVDRSKPSTIGARNTDLGPRTRQAYEELRRAIFTEGALDRKSKQLIAVAVAHLTGCARCSEGHTTLAASAGATPQEIAESIWVAAEVHAGGTFAHPTRTLGCDPRRPPSDVHPHGTGS